MRELVSKFLQAVKFMDRCSRTDLSSGLLNTEHQSQGREDHFNDTVDSCGEQAGRTTRQTDALEDLPNLHQISLRKVRNKTEELREYARAIIVNRVRARPLLPEHQDNTKASLVKHLLARASSLELHPKRQPILALKVGHDLVQLLHDGRVVLRQATHARQRVAGLGEPVLLHEPARRLVLEDDQQQHQARQHLQREGDAPLRRVAGVGDLPADAVVDEVAEHDARDVEQLHAADAAAADLPAGVLADVGRDYGGHEADAEAADEAAYVELVEALCVDGACGLDYGADEEDDIGYDESPFSTTLRQRSSVSVS